MTYGRYTPVNPEEKKAFIKAISQVKYRYELDEKPRNAWLMESCTRAHLNLRRAQERFNYYPNIFVSIYLDEQSTYCFNMGRDPLNEETDQSLYVYMDNRLLARILKREAHWNNAEIGCHIEYDRRPNTYQPDFHTIIGFFHL